MRSALVYVLILAYSLGVASLPFRKAAGPMNWRSKAPFLIVAILGVSWVGLSAELRWGFVRLTPLLSYMLDVVKHIICGAASGVLLMMVLCGCFDKVSANKKPNLS